MKRFNLFMLPILLLLIYSCSLNPRSLFPGSKSPDLKPKVETKTTVSTNSKNRKKPVPRRSTTKIVKPVVQELPEGWTVDRHPVAKWGMSLPTVDGFHI